MYIEKGKKKELQKIFFMNQFADSAEQDRLKKTQCKQFKTVTIASFKLDLFKMLKLKICSYNNINIYKVIEKISKTYKG